MDTARLYREANAARLKAERAQQRLAFLAAAVSARPALAQANFARPGSDYVSAPVISGDPAECALVCERDRRCRAWTFSYPTDLANRAVCWLKSNVPARVQSDCCVSVSLVAQPVQIPRITWHNVREHFEQLVAAMKSRKDHG